eukprot:GHVS01085477.1.p3 GENE.GHVS01085477.1~~GHVS01085477.1.p3  ORF type:complete len:117 (-),score=20.47 GHVS01085477.1:575-925(-)
MASSIDIGLLPQSIGYVRLVTPASFHLLFACLLFLSPPSPCNPFPTFFQFSAVSPATRHPLDPCIWCSSCSPLVLPLPISYPTPLSSQPVYGHRSTTFYLLPSPLSPQPVYGLLCA